MSNDVVQPANETSPASEELKNWVVRIEALLSEEMPPTTPPNKQIPSIYGNWKRLDDHFSFLPKTNMWLFVAFMKKYFNLNVQSYLEELQEKEDELWSYYEGGENFRAENTQNSKRFIEYLLANSCFLIFALVILANHELSKPNKILFGSAENEDTKIQTSNEYKKLEKFISSEENSIQCYMLTMDYQIPWFIVKAVYTRHSNLSSKLNIRTRHSNQSNKRNIPIHELVITAFNFIVPTVPKSKLSNKTITIPEDDFKHLLHIFHWSRTPKEKFHETNSGYRMNTLSIPSATSMQSFSTVFHNHDASGFDMSFSEGILSGVMHLPTMSHFQYKNKIYKNLLEFERGYGIVCGFPVTSYIASIVSLVRTEKDVTILQAKGILPRIENPKDILKSIQGYKTILSEDNILESDDLVKLEKKISKHNENRSSIKKCFADFKRRYCSNPWITLSVVGGILLFVLTLIQTVLSFIQTKYSVLGYKNQ